jgi:phosphate transport system substrate-binding protein
MKMNYKALLGAAVGLAMATTAFAAEITGAGGTSLNYQSIGSGGGIAQIKAKTVAFGATDKPLTPKELAAAGLTQFPTVIGGVVPVINVPGLKPGQVTLDGATLAAIYQGKVSRWDAPEIKKLNPGVALPGKAITVVHRSDGSGTTFIFATYLSRVSPSWKADVGADTAIDWPTGIGAKGNEGVAGNVAQISGSIGYVEYAYAKQNHLSHVKMINKEGKTTEPTVEAFRAAAAGADWESASKNNFYVILVDQPGAASWPITATTYILVYKNPPDQTATADTLKFFKWSFEKGDSLALGLDYVPLPENAIKAIEASWKGIQGSGM